MTRVAVLYGGISAEREVSLCSGLQVIGALREAGFDVTPIEVGRDLGAVLAALAPPPDAVFNALHGRYGEDGAIQGILDWLGIPYTHSGVRASALAMDKAAAKAVFVAAGLPVACGQVIGLEDLEAADPIARPYVIKPVNEGSSVGVRDHPQRRQPACGGCAHLALRPGGNGRGIRPRPRADRGRDGRPAARGDRNHRGSRRVL